MTARFAHSAHPAWAVTCWVDDNHVYVELPVKDSAPYITKHSLTEAGLSKALGQLRDIHRERRGSANYTIAPHPKFKPKGDFSDAQREKARDVLKRLKII